jgi:hypothetical protein
MKRIHIWTSVVVALSLWAGPVVAQQKFVMGTGRFAT